MSSRRRARASSTSIARQTPSFIVTASGWAPPIPPRPAVRVDRPAQGPAEVLARQPRRTSRTCPAGCPACRCRSTTRRSSGRTSSGPACSSSRKCSQVAQRPTRFEFAIRTRGAHSWVRSTPTGLPDWTSSVSSSPSRRSSRTIASNASQLPRRPPGAAVDDEVVGVLGDLGVEVVHQHAQGRFLGPAAAGQLGARGARGRAVDRSRSWRTRLLRQPGHDELAEAAFAERLASRSEIVAGRIGAVDVVRVDPASARRR